MNSLQVPPELLGGCISIGNFDGVHTGHATMLRALKVLASSQNRPAVAVTFDPHPIVLLRPEHAPPVLTTPEERVRLLKLCGMDGVVILPVNRQLLEMSPVQFFSDVVQGSFQAKGIVEGPNFQFGKGRAGTVATLERLCTSAGMDLRIAQAVEDSSQLVSSSRIRTLLSERSLGEAVKLLGHPYRLSGTVESGAQRGRTIGFPTANLGGVVSLIPANGVYAGQTELDGKRYTVAVSIGPNPTFADQRQKIECHIVGYSGDLYSKRLDVDLLHDIRPLCSFPSVNALIQQIESDVAECVRLIQVSLEWGRA